MVSLRSCSVFLKKRVLIFRAVMIFRADSGALHRLSRGIEHGDGFPEMTLWYAGKKYDYLYDVWLIFPGVIHQ